MMIGGNLEGSSHDYFTLRHQYSPAGTKKATRTLEFTISKPRFEHTSRQVWDISSKHNRARFGEIITESQRFTESKEFKRPQGN
jgi:hypothetical protein